MNRLQAEFERLFRATDGASERIGLVDSLGRVTTMLVDLARSRDWPALAALLNDYQEKLGLPLPAVSVNGRAGFRLWMPLAEPVATESAGRFLAALRRHYLGDVADPDLALLPVTGGASTVRRIPAQDGGDERWSAFIDPGMGSMFVEEGGLDFAPNPDRQADLLAAVLPIKAADFMRVLAQLGEAEKPVSTAVESSVQAVIGRYEKPQEFLMAVMSDASVPLALRIEAATALLAHGGKGRA